MWLSIINLNFKKKVKKDWSSGVAVLLKCCRIDLEVQKSQAVRPILKAEEDILKRFVPEEISSSKSYEKQLGMFKKCKWVSVELLFLRL